MGLSAGKVLVGEGGQTHIGFREAGSSGFGRTELCLAAMIFYGVLERLSGLTIVGVEPAAS
jgi:hypothetical protein